MSGRKLRKCDWGALLKAASSSKMYFSCILRIVRIAVFQNDACDTYCIRL